MKNWLRVTFAVDPPLLEDVMERLKSFCLRHAKPTRNHVTLWSVNINNIMSIAWMIPCDYINMYIWCCNTYGLQPGRKGGWIPILVHSLRGLIPNSWALFGLYILNIVIMNIQWIMNGFPTLCLCVPLLVSTILIVRHGEEKVLVASGIFHNNLVMLVHVCKYRCIGPKISKCA